MRTKFIFAFTKTIRILKLICWKVIDFRFGSVLKYIVLCVTILRCKQRLYEHCIIFVTAGTGNHSYPPPEYYRWKIFRQPCWLITRRLLMSYIYMEHLFLMFLDHTRRSTVGRTPLDEWSARRRDLYLTTHHTHNRQISMPAAAVLLRSWVQIPPGAWIFVWCECRVLSGRGLWDELIARPEESYRLWCVVVCDLETSRMGAPYIYIWQ